MTGKVQSPRLGAVCAGAAAVWSAGYLALCLLVLQGADSIAGWFIVLVGIATTLCVVGCFASRPRGPLFAAALILAGCALVGVLSIGLGFVPAAALALIAGLVGRDGTRARRDPGAGPTMAAEARER